jgi:hypothetical protein
VNKPPPSYPFNCTAYTALPESVRSFPNDDSKVLDFSNFEENDLAFKRGRTSGYTWGVVNGMRRDINWDQYDEPSNEWEIISPVSDFAEPGDSGSIITNVRGELIGLLFATDACPNNFDSAFFTPFRDIQDDVKKLSGGFLMLA